MQVAAPTSVWYPGLQSPDLSECDGRVVANPNTAVRKIERLLANTGLANQLGVVFDRLRLVRPSSYVNVDHSDMNGLTALVGAVQTGNGRAIPCLVETTYSDRLPSHEHAPARKQALRQARTEARKWQSFTGHYIDALQGLHDRLGFWPKLVFDRAFGNESLVTHLSAEGCTFYVRLKGGRFVHLDGERIETKALSQTDATVDLFGLTLQVVRSPKSRRATEPWYIPTNDRESSRNKVIRIYYHRFEIEESFKDLKHIFEFHRTRLNKPNSLKVILWLIFLGMALLYCATKPTKQTVHNRHPKKQTSWLRQATEQLHQAYGLVLWGEVLKCGWFRTLVLHPERQYDNGGNFIGDGDTVIGIWGYKPKGETQANGPIAMGHLSVNKFEMNPDNNLHEIVSSEWLHFTQDMTGKWAVERTFNDAQQKGFNSYERLH